MTDTPYPVVIDDRLPDLTDPAAVRAWFRATWGEEPPGPPPPNEPAVDAKVAAEVEAFAARMASLKPNE